MVSVMYIEAGKPVNYSQLQGHTKPSQLWAEERKIEDKNSGQSFIIIINSWVLSPPIPDCSEALCLADQLPNRV